METPATPEEVTGALNPRPDYTPPESSWQQRARLLAYLIAFGSVSTPEARGELGIMHPAARIQELRDRGHCIVTVWDDHTDATGHRHRVGRYRYHAGAQS